MPTWLAPLLAAGVPWLAYVFSLSAYAYWLDSGEFTAASVWLDIAHPPGQPLTCLWGKLFSLLPAGPLPFRIAMGQAVAGAIALLAIAVAVMRSVRFLGVIEPLQSAPIAVGFTWLLAGSFAFFFQSIRAEVYATQAMVVCIAFERMIALACRDAEGDCRVFGQATFALGLALANHHLVAVLALPVLGHALGHLTVRVGARAWGIGLLGGLLGLSVYVYLPLRALADPPLDLGHPATLPSFVWVVGAQIFARTFREDVQPLGERLADLVVLVVENFGIALVLLVPLGLYVLLRKRRAWPLAYVWTSAAATNLIVRASLGTVRSNPDTLGYLMPGFAALAGLSACGIGVVVGLLRRLSRTRAMIAAAPMLLGAANLAQVVTERGLSDFRATHLLDLGNEASLPTRAVLIATTPTAAFRRWEASAVEASRPDVTLLPMPFLNYPEGSRRLSEQEPVLARLIRDTAGQDRLPIDALVALAALRPVHLDFDARVALSLLPFVLPEGFLYRVLPRAPTKPELDAAIVARERMVATLTARLDRSVLEQETSRQLLWLHYLDALYFAHHGERAAALRAAERGLTLQSMVPELRGLRDALRVHEEGERIDIRPFLVADERASRSADD